MSVREFFCDVDDFCRYFEPFWHKQLVTRRLLSAQPRS